MQKEYFGTGSIKYLKEILEKEKPNNIFLVTGKESYNSKIKPKLEKILDNYNFIQFNEFSKNNKIEDIERGISKYNKKNYDLIVAIGGGSVIDIAKSINILSYQKYNPKQYLLKNKKLVEKNKKLVAIPTTSGTGSEATQFATVYIGKTKYSLNNKKILPDYSIIDPELSTNLPPNITASTGMDALCQSIESYWSTKSTKKSKEYAKKAIKLSIESIEDAVNNPNKKNRIMMAKAANLAGKAINISQTTACHSISYPLTSYFGISHGHAVALTLGKMFEYNKKITVGDCIDKRGVNYVKKTMKELEEIIDSNKTNKKIDKLLEDIKLEKSLSKLGIKSNRDIEIVISHGFNPERVKNNPRKLTEEKLRKILKSIY
tara:strand:+ start:124 stop:1248 length:1125 start_codon:yes stop_codon:yes gene_type:complete